MPQVTIMTEGAVPEFVYTSLYSKLNNPASLNKSNICMYKSNNPLTARPQIMAYANASRDDGAFVIFEDFNGQYREVFSLKLKYIMSFQIRQPNVILSSMDETGTDVRTCYFYVIRSTKSGYKIVWQGMANYCDHSYHEQYTFEVTSGINFAENSELIHSILKRMYKEGNYTDPANIEKIFDIYVYNESSMQYQFAKRL